MTEVWFSSEMYSCQNNSNVLFDMRIICPDGRLLYLPGFYRGENNWTIRFSAPQIGEYSYSTICSDPLDSGLHGKSGKFIATSYKGNNPLYKNGPIRVSQDKTHFEHEDGTPFFLVRRYLVERLV